MLKGSATASTEEGRSSAFRTTNSATLICTPFVRHASTPPKGLVQLSSPRSGGGKGKLHYRVMRLVLAPCLWWCRRIPSVPAQESSGSGKSTLWQWQRGNWEPESQHPILALILAVQAMLSTSWHILPICELYRTLNDKPKTINQSADTPRSQGSRGPDCLDHAHTCRYKAPAYLRGCAGPDPAPEVPNPTSCGAHARQQQQQHAPKACLYSPGGRAVLIRLARRLSPQGSGSFSPSSQCSCFALLSHSNQQLSLTSSGGNSLHVLRIWTPRAPTQLGI